MKKGALAKKLGLRIMKNFYAPLKTKKGNFIKDSKHPQLHRIGHVTNYKDFVTYYSIHVKPQYKKLIKSLAIKKASNKKKNKANPKKSKKSSKSKNGKSLL